MVKVMNPSKNTPGEFQKDKKGLFYYYFIIIILYYYNTNRPGFGLGFCQALGLAVKSTHHSTTDSIQVLLGPPFAIDLIYIHMYDGKCQMCRPEISLYQLRGWFVRHSPRVGHSHFLI